MTNRVTNENACLSPCIVLYISKYGADGDK